MRSAFALLICAVLVAGCSVAQPPAIGARNAATAVSRDVTATAEALYGDRLTQLNTQTSDRPYDRPDAHTASLGLTLASGEPTGTEPVALLAALVRRFPGKRVYMVNYSLPQSEIRQWHWTPETQTLQRLEGEYSGSIGTALLRGTASGVTTAAIEAIAQGSQPPPKYRK